MHRVLARDLSNHIEKKVRLRGWLNNLRSFGKLNFLLLRDRTGFAQIVIENKDEWRKIADLQPGAILSVEGRAVASKEAALKV